MPAIISALQPTRRRKGQRAFKDILNLYMMSSLTSHWPELNHMSISINKGAGKCSLYSRWPFPQVKIGSSVSEEEENGH